MKPFRNRLTHREVKSQVREDKPGGSQTGGAAGGVSQFSRSDKLQNESPPNFVGLSSRILPRILLRIFPDLFLRSFCETADSKYYFGFPPHRQTKTTKRPSSAQGCKRKAAGARALHCDDYNDDNQSRQPRQESLPQRFVIVCVTIITTVRRRKRHWL